MIAVLISLPLWFAGFIALCAGLVGIFHPGIQGWGSLLAIGLTGGSSLALYGAAAMCGLV